MNKTLDDYVNEIVKISEEVGSEFAPDSIHFFIDNVCKLMNEMIDKHL